MVVEISIPNSVIDNYNVINRIDKNAMLALLYYKDYADGNISLGNIADDLKISKRALCDIYENARMPIIAYSVNDLKSDIDTLEGIN